jgi:hypothetical protein
MEVRYCLRIKRKIVMKTKRYIVLHLKADGFLYLGSFVSKNLTKENSGNLIVQSTACFMLLALQYLQ